MVAVTNGLHLKAAFIISLVVGAECARVAEEIQSIDNYEQAADAEEGDVVPGWRSGNGACRPEDLETADAGASRYIHKINQLRTLAYDVRRRDCMKSCPVDFRNLGKRISKFQGCFDLAVSLIAGTATVDTEKAAKLTKVMLEEERSSLVSVMANMNAELSAVLKTHEYFPAEGPCAFSPENLNIAGVVGEMTTAASIATAVRGQLFGEECSREEQVQAYLEGKANAYGVAELAAKVMELATLAAHEDLAGLVTKADAQLSAGAVGDSLMQLDDGTGVLPIILVILAALAIVGSIMVAENVHGTHGCGPGCSPCQGSKRCCKIKFNPLAKDETYGCAGAPHKRS